MQFDLNKLTLKYEDYEDGDCQWEIHGNSRYLESREGFQRHLYRLLTRQLKGTFSVDADLMEKQTLHALPLQLCVSEAWGEEYDSEWNDFMNEMFNEE